MDTIEFGKPRGIQLKLGADAKKQRDAEAAFRSRLHRSWL